MIQVTPQMRILVATEPADFRKGIDGIAELCRKKMLENPFSGAVFVFCNRRKTAIKILVYDGRGFWLCHKRLSKGRLKWWPNKCDKNVVSLESHELAVLLCGGVPNSVSVSPVWRSVIS